MFSPKPAILLLLLPIFLFSFLQAQEPKLIPPIGHTDVINSVSFSPDGKLIVTASNDSTVKIWDAVSGRLLNDIKGQSGSIQFAQFSPDGKKIVTASNDSTGKICDAASGNLLVDLKGHTSSVTSAQFSPDGKKIVTASYDGTAKIWDAASGNLLADLKGHTGGVNSAKFSPDGKKIVTTSKQDSIARVWDAVSGKLLLALTEHIGWIRSVQFSPDEKKIVTNSEQDSIAWVWDAVSGKLLLALTEHTGWIRSAQFSPDGKKIVTASMDSTAKIWDAVSGKLLTNCKGHNKVVILALFSHDGKKIITASDDGTSKIWDVAKGNILLDLNIGELGYNGSFELSPDGKKIVTASYDSTAKIWDAASGNLLADLKGHTGGFKSAQFSRDGKKIFTVSLDNIYKVWDPASGNLVINLTELISEIKSVEYSLDGKRIFSFFSDSIARLWDAISGFLLLDQSDHLISSGFKFFHFSADGKKIVTTFGDSTLKVWDTKSGKPLFDLKGIKGNILSARLSPGGERILTVSDDNTIRIWDINSGKLLMDLVAKTDNIFFVPQFSPDGKKILTLFDGEPKIWDAANGDSLVEFKECDIFVLSAQFSQDGKKIVMLPTIGPIQIFDAVNGTLFCEIEITDAPWYPSAVFSPDGKKIVATINGSPYIGYSGIWNTDNGKLLVDLPAQGVWVNSIVFSPDGEKILAASRDFSATILDVSTGKLLYKFFAIDSTDYFYQIPSGYYMCTPNAAKLLHYVKGLQFISFEQLDIKYNRPDKILEAIGNTDTSLINAYKKAYYKRIKKLDIDTSSFSGVYSVPEADFTNRDSIAYEQTNENLILHIRGTDSVYLLDRFNVWVNDVPVFGMRGISIKHRKSNSFDTTVTITLSQGENRIETSIKNVNGTESYRIPLLVKFTPAVPKKEMAYFIGIGINNFADSSHPLQYSVKDIRNLADSLNKGGYIVIDTLFDKNVSVSNIKALKKRLLQTTENDKVIIAYSGHGLLSKDYDYYLSTYNVNFSQPDSGGLPYDDLENLLDSIPARKKLMLIDACHSGELDKEELSKIAQLQKQLDSSKKEEDRTGKGVDEVIVTVDTANRRLGINNSFELMQSLFVNVGKSTGATIIAAAGGTQFAWEGDKWNHSVFTFSILEAMTLHPTLKVNELKRLVGQRVYELTKGLQKPVSRNETNNFDWEIWQH